MLTLKQFITEEKTPGIVTKVTSYPGGIHSVKAYHKDADPDRNYSRDYNDLTWSLLHYNDHEVVHPRGMSADNIIGRADFTPHPEGGHYAGATHVTKLWRRKGVATAMYDAIKNRTGEKPKEPPKRYHPGYDSSFTVQSKSAKKFWDKYRKK